MSRDDNDPDKTPVQPFARRASSTTIKAPDWAKDARELARRLRAEQQGALDLGLQWRAVEAQRRANDCIDFARAFEGWKYTDPGTQVRTALAREWAEAQKEVEAWLAGPLKPRHDRR